MKEEEEEKEKEEEEKDSASQEGGSVGGVYFLGRTDGRLSVSTITLSGSELRRRRGRFVFLFTPLKYESLLAG